MTINQFIFSNRPSLRIKRHLSFWLVFILPRLLLNADLQKPNDFFSYQAYKPSLFLMLCILPVCIFSVYTFLYILLPFFQKKRFVAFILAGISVLILNYFLAQFFYQLARPAICPDCDAIAVPDKVSISLDIGINTAGFLSVVALGIKFTIHWYLQQKQNRILARQKISNELKLLKARIQPVFLFESLGTIYKSIDVNKNDAAEILIKLSDLLSYVLYECNNDFVVVQRELIITNTYIELEKIIRNKDFLIIYTVKNSESTKYIPSFIVLFLIQNCIAAFHNEVEKAPSYIEIEINAGVDILDLKICAQQPDSEALRYIFQEIVNTIRQRLETFYADTYELNFFEEKGISVINISLTLLADIQSINTYNLNQLYDAV